MSGNLLGLDESSSRQIVAFDIEPVITDNEYLVMFDKYITSLDSLTAARADYDDYIRGIKQYKHPFQQISIKSKTKGNSEILIKKFLFTFGKKSIFKKINTGIKISKIKTI